jgi:signal transduction histidine kinase
VVAHHVSLMAVQAEAATSLLPGRPVEARRSVEIIGDTARQALTELRRLLGVLRSPSERPETAPSASLADIGEVLDQVRGAGLEVELEVMGTPGPLAPSVDLLTGSGLGLAGIAERVASCGGNLTVGPTPAGGFAVTARLPAL